MHGNMSAADGQGEVSRKDISGVASHLLAWSDALACRAFDFVIAIAALILVSPILLYLAIMVKCADGGPAIFAHERIGRGGRRFKCLKLRSMVVDADERLAAVLAECADARREWERDHKLRDDPRITPFGGFLRRSSLDELPQLFNVLRGEMSIVGPRPIVAKEASRYGARLAWYCQVRPGITGLWQVSGRNDVAYRRRVAMDILYARNKTVWLDIKILFLTIPAVLTAKGAS